MEKLVVIITGMSGSGKTSALRAMEDIGFFCIDNMPLALLPKLLQLKLNEESASGRIALVMDLRQEGFIDQYAKIFRQLKNKGFRIMVIYLDAGEEALIHRYSETRRAHPLAGQGSIIQSIALEREKLAPLRKMATKIIDTSSRNVHQLKTAIQRLFLTDEEKRKHFFIHVQSFGYRYGLPADADLVFDVRFLPNPHFVEHLRSKTGNDQEVRDYVMKSDVTQKFRDLLFQLVDYLLPLYVREGKARLSIAFGCTAGKHRSVTLANEAGIYLSQQDFSHQVTHRDIAKS